jgi:hypothetical protein
LKRRTPEESKKAAREAEAAGTGASLSLNDDPDRPSLHHGKPPGSMTGDDLPGLVGMPDDMHQMVAVSDAVNREMHPFARTWLDDQERSIVLAKMQAFARAKLAAYKSGPAPAMVASGAKTGATSASSASATSAADASAVAATAEVDPGAPVLKRGIPTQPKTQAATAPAAPKTQAKTTTTKTTATNSRTKKGVAAPAQVALLDEDLKGFTLSYGGAPTFVYTAHTDGMGSALRYVTIVAQDNGVGTGGGLGELKLAMASVTDAGHLDRAPRLRLIDAVDAEASNRASLLFEMRWQHSRQFALYRVIAARPEQIFLTGSTE